MGLVMLKLPKGIDMREPCPHILVSPRPNGEYVVDARPEWEMFWKVQIEAARRWMTEKGIKQL